LPGFQAEWWGFVNWTTRTLTPGIGTVTAEIIVLLIIMQISCLLLTQHIHIYGPYVFANSFRRVLVTTSRAIRVERLIWFVLGDYSVGHITVYAGVIFQAIQTLGQVFQGFS
jgi:hypothetical protein